MKVVISFKKVHYAFKVHFILLDVNRTSLWFYFLMLSSDNCDDKIHNYSSEISKCGSYYVLNKEYILKSI
jgi:hypothetical protein